MTKDESKIRNLKSKIGWLAVGFVYFFALGSIPLLGPDESRYAQVAREMFERNDWITPTLGGFKWFEKPALLYWLQIISYKIFGVSEFAARFGSALCGLGTIFSLRILGKTVRSRRSAVRSPSIENQPAIVDLRLPVDDFADWLAIIAASSIGLLAFSRGASFDIILTFPVTAALVAFFIFDRTARKNSFTFHFSLFAFHFFVGVALLAKGLIGVVFPFAIVAFYYVLSRRFPPKPFVFSIFWGTILSLLVAAVWYVPMYLTNGWTFIDEFFVQHHFARYTSNKYQHPQPFWFFALVLPLMTVPWLPFFLASVWDLIKVQGSKFKVQSSKFKVLSSRFKVQSRENSPRLPVSSSPRPAPSPLRLFALAWLLVPLVFFSFSGSKLPGYILPALPAALILTAEYVARFARNSRKRRIGLQIVAFATFACVVIALQFFVMSLARGETVKGLIETADARGYATEKILSFNTISHNAEFYGAGRLVRTADGKQRRFFSIAEMLEEMRREEAKDWLVLAPLEYWGDLTRGDLIDARALDDNGELGIFLIRAK